VKGLTKPNLERRILEA